MITDVGASWVGCEDEPRFSSEEEESTPLKVWDVGCGTVSGKT